MRLNVRFSEQNNKLDVGFGNTQFVDIGGTYDYNRLTNRPSINSIVLEGNLSLSDLGLGAVYYDTTANWNLQRDLVAERSAIYIYSDHTYIDDGHGNQIPIAGIKIGDGTSYLIDMPFATDSDSETLLRHISNHDIHITNEERASWNNKVTAFMDSSNPDTLVLSKI